MELPSFLGVVFVGVYNFPALRGALLTSKTRSKEFLESKFLSLKGLFKVQTLRKKPSKGITNFDETFGKVSAPLSLSFKRP